MVLFTWMTHTDLKGWPLQRPTPTPLTRSPAQDNKTRERWHCPLVIILRVCLVCVCAGGGRWAALMYSSAI